MNNKRTLAAETVNKIGETVTVMGWVANRRDHGKIAFYDLRDRSGILQVVDTSRSVLPGIETVVAITGVVKKRPENLVNPHIATGTVELEAARIEVLSPAKDLPFPIDTDGYDLKEELRLKYRYLDLRRKRLRANIILRSQFIDKVRQFLFSQDFTEIETPILTKSTPEGSRDFLVPSRMQPGKFYALPQSPQQYKQLLMVAGFERYFQIARCVRDEDLRADRGFEHTQIDIEMSFVDREDVMAIDELMITSVIESMGYRLKQKPFPVFTFEEAMKKYGADKFDLRTEADKKNGVLAFAWVVDFPFFEKTESGGWTFTHNPFSAPQKEHKKWLLNKERIGDILTTQYDLVCNGYEVGGGSIRGHESSVLSAVFEIMGHSPAAIEAQFGHMLEAFRYGVPPHGGLAHGIERLLMTITGEPYLREVVAFPMTAGGRTSVMDAPSTVSDAQLRELGLAIPGNEASGLSVYERIVAMLKQYNAVYTPYEHEAVYTSEQAAKVRGTSLHQGAKALIMMADGKPVMLVMCADTKADTKQFKALYAVKDLRMATRDEVKALTAVEVGAVPPFGHLFKMPLYIDDCLFENKEVVFNAGDHTRSIAILSDDYKAIAKGTVGKFASVSHASP